VGLALLVGGAGPSGAEIAEHGVCGRVIPCAACHGLDFRGEAAIGAPSIAGESQDMILAQLSSIAAGEFGNNFAMRDVARALTPDERRSVAAIWHPCPSHDDCRAAALR
jgi:cytochrome c553